MLTDKGSLAVRPIERRWILAGLLTFTILGKAYLYTVVTVPQHMTSVILHSIRMFDSTK
jgi:hypothetical protein